MKTEIDLWGCGFVNGQELLGYYTMAQTSFILFITVIIGLTVCMAWKITDEESHDRELAQEWLKREDPGAAVMRDNIMKKHGRPGSSVKPEGDTTPPPLLPLFLSFLQHCI